MALSVQLTPDVETLAHVANRLLANFVDNLRDLRGTCSDLKFILTVFSHC